VPPPVWSDREDEAAWAAPAVLIPPHADPEGRDSLGRGLDDASAAVAAAADPVARREKEYLWYRLEAAYREPYAAKAVLGEMVESHGWVRAATPLWGNPTRLGRLRGRSGWFAGREAELERARAIESARDIPHTLNRIEKAEARAARAYRDSVLAQRDLDAIAVPGLSPRSEAAVAALAAADETARAALWRGLMADKGFAAEMAATAEAVRRRFGDRAAGALFPPALSGPVAVPAVGHRYLAAFDSAARTVRTLQNGQRASDREDGALREAARQKMVPPAPNAAADRARLAQIQTQSARPRMRPR
jgi:hypothetical protein